MSPPQVRPPRVPAFVFHWINGQPACYNTDWPRLRAERRGDREAEHGADPVEHTVQFAIYNGDIGEQLPLRRSARLLIHWLAAGFRPR
jgi:hypothetical protein